MRRRQFIAGIGAAAAWPLAARAQQSAPLPIVGVLSATSKADVANMPPLSEVLQQFGFVDGRNVAIEYHWADGQYDRLPAMADDLVRRPVAVIAAIGGTAPAAAKAATSKIPIVFQTAGDPVTAQLVASLNRPGGNITGITSLNSELAPKRLGVLHDMLPKATRIGVLLNPTNVSMTEATLRELSEGARALGLQVRILNAGT